MNILRDIHPWYQFNPVYYFGYKRSKVQVHYYIVQSHTGCHNNISENITIPQLMTIRNFRCRVDINDGTFHIWTSNGQPKVFEPSQEKWITRKIITALIWMKWTFIILMRTMHAEHVNMLFHRQNAKSSQSFVTLYAIGLSVFQDK